MHMTDVNGNGALSVVYYFWDVPTSKGAGIRLGYITGTSNRTTVLLGK